MALLFAPGGRSANVRIHPEMASRIENLCRFLGTGQFRCDIRKSEYIVISAEDDAIWHTDGPDSLRITFDATLYQRGSRNIYKTHLTPWPVNDQDEANERSGRLIDLMETAAAIREFGVRAVKMRAVRVPLLPIPDGAKKEERHRLHMLWLDAHVKYNQQFYLPRGVEKRWWHFGRMEDPRNKYDRNRSS